MKKLFIASVVVAMTAMFVNSCARYENMCEECKNEERLKIFLKDENGKVVSTLYVDSIEYLVDKETNRFKVTNLTRFSVLDTDTANTEIVNVQAIRVYDGTRWYNPIGGSVFSICDGEVNIADGVIINTGFGNKALKLSGGMFIMFRFFMAVGTVGEIAYNGVQYGATWFNEPSGISGQSLNAVTHGFDKFVAVGGGGTILTSSYGFDWEQQTSGVSSSRIFYCVTYGNGIYVAGGTGNTIITSPNAINWTQASGLTGGYIINAIIYANNKFVAVGTNGTILTSDNGGVWMSRTSNTINNLKGVAYGDDKFVVVGANGTILTSVNGINWTPISMSTTNNELKGVTYGNYKFVAIGGNAVISSTDGNSWGQPQSLPTTNILNSITYGYDKFVVVGNNGTILISTNGNAWTPPSTLNTSENLLGVCIGD